jgi:putative tricarboxylic transport membrane protein
MTWQVRACTTSPLTFLLASVPLWTIAVGSMMSDGHAAVSDWKPDRNVEFNVGAGAGGGSDTLARTLQAIWQARGLVKPSVTVVNKPPSIAMAHLQQQPGNPHYLMSASTTFLTNHITGASSFKYGEFTPIALLGEEPIIYSVRADSRLKSGKDLVEVLRKDPKSLSVGIAAAPGNHNHIGMALVMKEAGGDVRNLKVVVFDSSAKGMTALLGGHVDLYASSIDAPVQHIQAGKVRALAVATEKRVRDELSSVPTWREQGLNVVASDIRIIVAPKGLTEPQIGYWDEVFTMTTESEEWKKFASASYALSFHMKSRETGRLLDARYAQFRALLTELGLAK